MSLFFQLKNGKISRVIFSLLMTPNAYFKTRYSFDRGRKEVWKSICEDLQKYVSTQDNVLDLGAGYCDFINNIKAAHKIAVDVNEDCRQYCQDGIAFWASSIEDLSFLASGSIDVAFMSNLLEHLDDDQISKVIKELRRITRHNSRLIILQPNYRYAYREYFDDYTHKKVFTHVSLADLMNSHGFSSLKICPKYLPLTIKSALPKSYWLTKLYLRMPFKLLGKQMLLIFQKEE